MRKKKKVYITGTIIVFFIIILLVIVLMRKNENTCINYDESNEELYVTEGKKSGIKYILGGGQKLQDKPGNNIYDIYADEKVQWEKEEYFDVAIDNEEYGNVSEDITDTNDSEKVHEEYNVVQEQEESKKEENKNEGESKEVITGETEPQPGSNIQEKQEEIHKSASGPPAFLIDTDFSSDVDDALAISTASYFHNNGMMRIKGVALCCSSTRGAHAMSALLGQHNIWNVPIAADWDDGLAIGCSYHLGMTSFPYQEDYYADTVNYYRMLLAQTEEPVNIITLGQLINMSALMESGPDVHSPLSGKELIAQKVKCLYIVGGKSNGKPENNLWYAGENYGINKWYGNSGVVDSAVSVAKNWPTKVVFMEADICGSFNVGTFFNEVDKKQNDIITKALIDSKNPHGSASFDPMGMYIAVADANGLLDKYQIQKIKGTMRIYNGTSQFTDADSTKEHYRITKVQNDAYYRYKINKMLASEYEKRSGKKVEL